MRGRALLSKGFSGLTLLLALAPLPALLLAYAAPAHMAILLLPFALAVALSTAAGLLFPNRRMTAGLGALALTLALGIALFAAAAGLNFAAAGYACVLVAASLFALRLTPLRAGHELPPDPLYPAVGLHLIAALMARQETFAPAAPWLLWLTPIYFLCVLLIMNRMTLVEGVAMRKGGNPPRRIVWRNRGLTALVAVGALILVNLHRIRDAVYWLAQKAVLAVLWILSLISALAPANEGGGDGGGGGMDLSGLGETSEPGWLAVLLEQVLRVLALAAAAALVILALIKVGKMLYRGYLLLKARFARYAASLNESYVDEAESVFDWGEMSRVAGERVQAALARLRARRPKWAEMDNRARVRYAFQTRLKRQPGLPEGRTARTLIRSGDLSLGKADADAFAEDYDVARYSDAPIPQHAADNARRALE